MERRRYQSSIGVTGSRPLRLLTAVAASQPGRGAREVVTYVLGTWCYPSLRSGHGLDRRRMAEREGFEPPIGLHLCRISSAVRSTTLPPLQAPRRTVLASFWSGGVLGEDEGSDKARGRTKSGQNAVFPGCSAARRPSRRGALLSRGRNGRRRFVRSRLCGAPLKKRCTASGTRDRAINTRRRR